MQALFQLNKETGLIGLNKEWIQLVPEFKAIYNAKTPTKGDHENRKKLHANRIFTFIYMLLDFKSPIRTMDQDKKFQEALRVSELDEEDINKDVRDACAVYEWYQEHAARSLRTLKAMQGSLTQLDRYFETVDFTKTDKKGELLHSTGDYLKNMKLVKDAYESLKVFEEAVHKELEQPEFTIRGQRSLGGKEGKRTSWEEGARPEAASRRMEEIGSTLFGSGITARIEDEEAEEEDEFLRQMMADDDDSDL